MKPTSAFCWQDKTGTPVILNESTTWGPVAPDCILLSFCNKLPTLHNIICCTCQVHHIRSAISSSNSPGLLTQIKCIDIVVRSFKCMYSFTFKKYERKKMGVEHLTRPMLQSIWVLDGHWLTLVAHMQIKLLLFPKSWLLCMPWKCPLHVNQSIVVWACLENTGCRCFGALVYCTSLFITSQLSYSFIFHNGRFACSVC